MKDAETESQSAALFVGDCSEWKLPMEHEPVASVHSKLV